MTENVFFGAIADDFTGASDLAAMLARSGAPVSLRLGARGLDDEGAANPFEVVALKCRTSPVADAVRETRAALSWLKARGAQRFFWKYCSTFDSTAKGNIGPVSEALMADLGATQTIYCPAFPQNGRSIYMGHLYVGGALLSDSPMRDHPLTPMRDSNLMRLLAPQTKRPVGLVSYPVVRKGAQAVRVALARLAQEGVAHVVADAIEDDHLGVLAEACRDMPFLTGGSAVAAPLPELYRTAGLLDFDARGPALPETADAPLALSGSCSAMTRRQVSHFRERGAAALRLDPFALAESGKALAEARAWLDDRSLQEPKLIYASADPAEVEKVQATLGRERAGALVEEALSDLALHGFSRGVRRFIVAGGETSGAVVQKLGVTKLDIGPEIAPGVPWTFARLGGGTMALALKSGNFGEEAFFLEALEKLED